MSEPKPFASLSSGLLARKGAARPAMRPQGFGQAGQSLEDLGWNDMGFEPPKPSEVTRDASHDAFGDHLAAHPRVHPSGLTPVQSPVHSQQADLAERVAALEPASAPELESDDSAELYQAQLDEVSEAEAQAATASETDIDLEVEADETAEPVSLVQVKPVRSPAPVAVERPQAVAAPAPRAVAPRPLRQPRSAPGSKAKAAFTLRLEPGRHLKLRLACALDGRSAQHIVTDALDQFLSKMPELDAMAQTANRKG